jgi:uncharacterized phage protein gp47/JayE
MTLLSDLLATKTEADALAFMLSKLQANGIQETSWAPFSLPTALLQGESSYLADLDATIARIAAGGFLDLAALVTPEGGPGWLDLLCQGVFQETRKPATTTRGQVTLVDAGANGPTTIQPGQLFISDPTRRFLFQNLGGGTLPLSGSLPLTLQASSPGAAYNLSNGALTVLQSSLPGVTVSNPAISGTTSWITQQGTDVESNALYVARCKNKWGTLGSGSTSSAYLYWATFASSEVTRTRLLEDPDTGTVTVVVAGPSGPLTTDGYNAVNALLQVKRVLCVKVVATNATGTNTNIAGNVIVDGAYDLTATLAAVQANVLAYARSTAIAGTMILDKLIAAIVDTPGVTNLALTGPTSDLTLLGTQVFTPNFLLTASR